MNIRETRHVQKIFAVREDIATVIIQTDNLLTDEYFISSP